MWNDKKIACVIPARLQSTRFPRKILEPLKGKPLIEWVWSAASKVSYFDELVFAIDSEETARVIEGFGGRYYMTSLDCPVGTDRLVELQKRSLVSADVWVNWQADGPFITEKTIENLLQSCDKDNADVWTLKKRLHKEEDIISPDVSKVVCDANGKALYFSRATLPFYRKVPEGKEKIYYKHVGLYAYSDNGLKKISTLQPCDLEVIEQLEQLRFLYNGMHVQVHETQYETFEIDLPEHVKRAEGLLPG
ncbi:MAG: 3-deoxy-manno-octulosonate cytidylyltransferase [Chlamydiae bacterium]|nr:3-deoxy-manno-octulosonate cytidylyltransferase [Chlamydiota bacterium]